MQTAAKTRLNRIDNTAVDAVEMNPAPWRSCLGVGQRKRACSRTYAASGVSGSNGLGSAGSDLVPARWAAVPR